MPKSVQGQYGQYLRLMDLHEVKLCVCVCVGGGGWRGEMTFKWEDPG